MERANSPADVHVLPTVRPRVALRRPLLEGMRAALRVIDSGEAPDLGIREKAEACRQYANACDALVWVENELARRDEKAKLDLSTKHEKANSRIGPRGTVGGGMVVKVRCLGSEVCAEHTLAGFLREFAEQLTPLDIWKIGDGSAEGSEVCLELAPFCVSTRWE